MNRLYVVGGSINQRIAESIAYRFYTTPWGSDPTDVDVEVWDVTNGVDDEEDVTGTVITGSPSVSGDLLTCPHIYNLTLNHRYRMDVVFTAESNIFAVPIYIRAVR